MIIVVTSCLKDADGARTRSDQNLKQLSQPDLDINATNYKLSRHSYVFSNKNVSDRLKIFQIKIRGKRTIFWPEQVAQVSGNHYLC
jgi:hypothetical protein